MKKIRVVFYARVSTDRDDQLHSFAVQQEYFKKYILSNNNMIFVKGYADEGITGVNTKHRVAFLQMMEDARLGKFDLILTKEVSRFARNTVDTLSYTRELSRLNIGVIFTNDGIDTRQKDGELRLTIMASLAQDESRKISERVNWAVQRNYENGVAHGGMPFGYRRNKNKEIVIYEPEAQIVRKIFELYLNGLGSRRILQELRSDPVIKNKAINWGESKISKIIKNPKYCGDLVQGLSYTEDFLTKSRKLQKDKDKHIYIKDHHEPIVSREIFEKAQAERMKRLEFQNRKIKTCYSNRSVFSNKIECGHCHTCYIRKTSLKKGKRYTSWKCSRKDRLGVNACPNSQNVKEDVLYNIMQMTYDYFYINSVQLEKKFTTIFSRLINQENINNDTERYENELQKYNKQLERLIDLNIQGFISTDTFIKKHTELENQIKQINEKIKLLNEPIDINGYQSRFDNLMGIVKTKINNWKDIKDEIISKILYKIEVISKEEYNVYLSFGHKIVISGYGTSIFPPNSSSME